MTGPKIYTDPATGMKLVGNIYQDKAGNRFEYVDIKHNCVDRSHDGLEFVYSAFATPTAAEAYLRGEPAPQSTMRASKFLV